MRFLRFPLLAALLILLVPAAAGAAAVKPAELTKRATVKAGVATVTVANPNAVALKGSLALRLGKKVVAKAKLSLGPSASRGAKLKLDRGARQALARSGKLRLAAVAVLRSPAGKPLRTRANLTLAPAPKQGGKPGPAGPGPATPESIDGTYHGSEGLTLVIQDNAVISFSGQISTYCASSSKQKVVYYGMFGDDPDPVVAADGSFAYEATTNYGFVKLKYEGRVSGTGASGKLVVEDRSPIFGSGRIEFDYCFAGADWSAMR